MQELSITVHKHDIQTLPTLHCLNSMQYPFKNEKLWNDFKVGSKVIREQSAE